MKVKFESIFWRQASAALLATAAYTLISGEITDAVGPLFVFFLVLALQECAIDRIRERRKKSDRHRRSKRDETRRRICA